MSSSFKMDTSSLMKAIQGMESKAQAALYMYADTSAAKLETDAKTNARWENHTGDARRRMKGSVLTQQNGYKLALAHGVDYGIWLELAHERKFAIIEETIRFTGTLEVLPGLAKLLERLGG